ncbi:hypothetical protein OSH39_20335 [Mycobacterium ulcerans]|uniref:3-dehydroquinate synthase C-terminal domain-containing protein n=1 Tax=Mycobacterium ulcerans TaxID=1809 RepID=A0ABY3VAR7_MYCUL|nr:hypothetical protein [Mycobacterium ulcerans]MEB3906667.1 hypothetical protein [Mycobacterium ulcerans]MEB3910818.1 hypothetical protein [Mycobacterium ulcerans]MEB3921073.1 hypothetical protein [Mycobacterium ulcerans]MEB3925174.1 hypothetical protein [Mycobacterium ulcerans]MEB3929338.1 hypothetical protein [Mycobacterium ulcerans]
MRSANRRSGTSATGCVQPAAADSNPGTLERCVDYGHTFSPTIEMHAQPALLHGEAVNLDMAVTTAIGELRGYVSEDEANRIYRVMVDLGLPLWDDTLATPELLIEALIDTVRHRDGQQRLPLPVGIGHHRFVNDVTPEEIQCAVAMLRRHHETLTGSVAASSGVA